MKHEIPRQASNVVKKAYSKPRLVVLEPQSELARQMRENLEQRSSEAGGDDTPTE
jgi:hypothetical protein